MRVTWAIVLVCSVSVSALELDLSVDSLAQALDFGRTGLEARRTEFHRPYRIAIGRAPLDFVEVVTPFRRVVLAAEARMRAGERLLGQRDALAILGERPQQVDLRLELTFHPLNTLVGVPTYDIALMALSGRQPLPMYGVERIPRFGPRVDGVQEGTPSQSVGRTSGPTRPLLGGAVVASFDGRLLERRTRYQLRVLEQGVVVAQGEVDFESLR